MKEINELIKLVRAEIPPRAIIKKTERETILLIDGKKLNRSKGLRILINERDCSRQEALRVYNSIRFKLPGEQSNFEEKSEHEWEFEMEFIFQEYAGQ